MITERIGKSSMSAGPDDHVEEERDRAERNAERVATHEAVLDVAQRDRRALHEAADAVDGAVDDLPVDHTVEPAGEATTGATDEPRDALVVVVGVAKDRRDLAEL